VRAEGDELHLVEVYYPSEAQHIRYHQDVMALLERGMS